MKREKSGYKVENRSGNSPETPRSYPNRDPPEAATMQATMK